MRLINIDIKTLDLSPLYPGGKNNKDVRDGALGPANRASLLRIGQRPEPRVKAATQLFIARHSPSLDVIETFLHGRHEALLVR